MYHRPDADVVWQTYYRGELICTDEFVWHVHVLRMFTFREQEELMNNTFTYISWWEFVWQLPNNIVVHTVS
jgi:hypothetical protein